MRRRGVPVAMVAGLLAIGATWGLGADAPETPVYVQIVNGLGAEDKTDEGPAAEWITEKVTSHGSSRASAHTSWIALSEREQEVYASMMGGRLIKGKATPNEDGNIAVTISGYKIGRNQYKVSLQAVGGAREVIKLTQYPGERNVYLALHVGKPDEDTAKPNQGVQATK